MAISQRTKTILANALADNVAATEIFTTAGVDALSLGTLSANGLVTRTSSSTSAARTLTGTANQVTVVNGNGVSGNPIISLPAAVNVVTSYSVGGTKVVGAQGALIADVTPAADGTAVGTAFNTLLARLRAHGLIAT